MVKGSRHPRADESVRFIQRTTIPDLHPASCWEWNGHLNNDGYGSIRVGGRYGRMVKAHRFAYELVNGRIQPNLEIDHLCRNRRCVNPAHLEAVSHAANVSRGMHPNMVAHREGVCSKGHSLADAYRVKSGKRCRVCAKSQAKEWYSLNHEARNKARNEVRLAIRKTRMLAERLGV